VRRLRTITHIETAMNNNKHDVLRGLRKQKGFGLVETAFALLLILAVAMQVFSQQLEDARNLTAINQGKGVVTVANGVNASLGEFYGNWVASAPGSPMQITLSDGVTVVTIADPSKPTIAELKQLGYLPPNFSSLTTNGGNYVVSVSKVPAACVAPSCNLEALVCIDQPIRKMGNAGAIDTPRLGLAVKNMGPDAGGSVQESPSVISGLGGAWTVPNNLVSPSNQTGILCMRAGYGSSAWAAFFRVDGSRWMKADANMGGNSVVNAKQLVTLLKTVNEVCIDPGAISGGRDASGSEVTMVCRSGRWKVQSGVNGRPGDPCTPEGGIATSLTTDEQLVCKNGRYVRLVNLIAKNIEVGRLNVVDGQSVIKPSCDVGGVPDYSFNMNKLSVDVTVAPPHQSQYLTTTDNGSSWSVLLRLRDDTGNEVSGNGYNLSAVMKLECKY